MPELIKAKMSMTSPKIVRREEKKLRLSQKQLNRPIVEKGDLNFPASL